MRFKIISTHFNFQPIFPTLPKEQRGTSQGKCLTSNPLDPKKSNIDGVISLGAERGFSKEDAKVLLAKLTESSNPLLNIRTLKDFQDGKVKNEDVLGSLGDKIKMPRVNRVIRDALNASSTNLIKFKITQASAPGGANQELEFGFELKDGEVKCFEIHKDKPGAPHEYFDRDSQIEIYKAFVLATFQTVLINTEVQNNAYTIAGNRVAQGNEPRPVLAQAGKLPKGGNVQPTPSPSSKHLAEGPSDSSSDWDARTAVFNFTPKVDKAFDSLGNADVGLNCGIMEYEKNHAVSLYDRFGPLKGHISIISDEITEFLKTVCEDCADFQPQISAFFSPELLSDIATIKGLHLISEFQNPSNHTLILETAKKVLEQKKLVNSFVADMKKGLKSENAEA